MMLLLCPFQCLLKRFVKRDKFEGISSDNLVRLDPMEKEILISPSRVDIGMGAESEIKVSNNLVKTTKDEFPDPVCSQSSPSSSSLLKHLTIPDF